MSNGLFVAVYSLGLALMATGALPDPHNSQGTQGANHPPEFGPPEVILDGSEDAGKLYPHYADFDEDGRIDRLVGVRDRLLVYRNRGTSAEPKYAVPTWFDEAEPSARIPAG